MVGLVNAFAVALVLTAAFALRFRYWRRPGVLAAYFSLFFSLEWIAAHYFLPPDAMGLEIATVCFALVVPLVVAMIVLDRFEKRNTREEDEARQS